MFTREEVATLYPTISKTALGRRFELGRRYTASVSPLEAQEAVQTIEKVIDQAKSATTFLNRLRRLAGIR